MVHLNYPHQTFHFMKSLLVITILTQIKKLIPDIESDDPAFASRLEQQVLEGKFPFQIHARYFAYPYALFIAEYYNTDVDWVEWVFTVNQSADLLTCYLNQKLLYWVHYKDPDVPVRRHEIALKHDFLFTVNEMGNLINGRAVLKRGRWYQHRVAGTIRINVLTCTSFQEYDLSNVLTKYSILELENAENKTIILASLYTGHKVLVTIRQKSGTRQQYIQANPEYKSITILPS